MIGKSNGLWATMDDEARNLCCEFRSLVLKDYRPGSFTDRKLRIISNIFLLYIYSFLHGTEGLMQLQFHLFFIQVERERHHISKMPFVAVASSIW